MPTSRTACSTGGGREVAEGAVAGGCRSDQAPPAKRPRRSAGKVAFELRRRRRLEGLRAQLREELGRALQGHAFSQEGEPLEALEPPRECFNRWLFSGDARSLEGEILDDLPVKLRNWYPTEVAKQRENVRSWRRVMRNWWAEHKRWDENCELQGFIFSEDLERIPFTANELRVKTREVVEPVVGPIVRGVVAELSRSRKEAHLNFSPAALSASTATAGSLVEDGNDVEEGRDYSVSVDFDPLKRIYVLSAIAATTGEPNEAEASFKISQWAYDKLAELFQPESTSCSFWEEVFCCLCRYEALCGGEVDSSEGAGLQAALPQEVFDLLPPSTVEAFASPFNVSRARAAGPAGGARKYHRYFSLFEEDRVFSSFGNFFEQARDLDSIRHLGEDVFFEGNPPFDVFVMDRFVDRVEALLSAAEAEANVPSARPSPPRLSFLLAFPEWQPNAFRLESPIARLQASRFLRETRVRRPHQHRYVKGRCWNWSKLPEDRGPPLAPGVSKSRIALLSAGGAAAAKAASTERDDDARTAEEDARESEENVGREQEVSSLVARLCKAW